MTEKELLEALKNVIEPDIKENIVDLELVDYIRINGNNVAFNVNVNSPALHTRKKVEEACLIALKTEFGTQYTYDISIVALPAEKDRKPEHRTLLRGVKKIIAIASGKGGVGKSTISSNLAVALQLQGYKVGLIDADIYGPSIPIMFDVVNEKPTINPADGKNLIVPVESYGVKLLSIGFFADLNQAIVWRGPMASKALTQMFTETDWGKLDYLLIDLPPGTGDIHLSLVQLVPLTGAVIVSTPQEVALADAKKGIEMFRLPSANVPILGLIENMAWFTPAELPNNKYYIFGKDGLSNLAEKMDLPILGQIPIVQSIREAGDVGRPAVLQEGTVQSEAFLNVAKKLNEIVEKL
jgi:ATP-binding protein involved in chromosome partitioning